MTLPFGLDLNAIWFVLVGVLFTGYVLLDGFDLGVGVLHLFTKTNDERRMMMNSIGPVWDGNEVWLVTGGGALFAAFPEVYATVFSGFYIAFMLLLFSLIFRAVSLEFRNKLPMPWWQKMWDIGFSLGSILSALLIGVAIGNIAKGIPLDNHHEYMGTFLGLLHPYPLLIGLTTIALFAVHGGIYIAIKTEGEFQSKILKWLLPIIGIFVFCYAIATIATLLSIPHMIITFFQYPALFVFPALNIFAILALVYFIRKKQVGRAFLSSCATMLLLMIIFGIGMFPNLVFSTPIESHSLTIYNAASSQKTLGIMLIIAIIGMPIVAAYTASIYWIFRGKVKSEKSGY